MLEVINELDTQLFLLINGGGSPLLDTPMEWLSHKKGWYPFYGLLLFFLIRKTGWQFYVPLIGIVLIITCCDQLTSSFMKPFFERLRPCHEPSLIGKIQMISPCGGQFGFASSHAANSFGLAVFFHLIFRNKYTILLLIWAGLVSYSRVYLGAHYPMDVLVGAAIGFGFAYLTFQVMQRSKFRITTD